MQLIRPADQPVTQDELLAWFGYRNQIESLRRKMKALESDLHQRIAAGSPVEPGPHHACLERSEYGGQRLKIR